MKVIGIGDSGEYICTLQHDEIEKFMNLYYGKMERLKVGGTIDLGRGYNFAQRIDSALNNVQNLIKGSQDVITAITGGLNILAINKAAQEQRERERSEAFVIKPDACQ